MAQSGKLFTFGPFHLDVEQCVLLRDGKPVPLPPKAMAVLSVLVENHGKVVQREELMRRAWPDAFVEEGNLTVNIFALRKALAEGLNGVSPIETIPKRGYRFTAAVETQVPPAAQAVPAQPTPVEAGAAAIPDAPHPLGARPGRWKALVLAGASAAALLLAVELFLYFRKVAVPGPAPRVSLVVLPFQNLTGKPGNDYLSDSLTEEMIARLARTYGGDVLVIGRDSAMSYQGRRDTLTQIAAALGYSEWFYEWNVPAAEQELRRALQLDPHNVDAHHWYSQVLMTSGRFG